MRKAKNDVLRVSRKTAVMLVGSQLPNSKRFLLREKCTAPGAPQGRAWRPWRTATDPGGALDIPSVAEMRLGSRKHRGAARGVLTQLQTADSARALATSRRLSSSTFALFRPPAWIAHVAGAAECRAGALKKDESRKSSRVTLPSNDGDGHPFVVAAWWSKPPGELISRGRGREAA